MTLLDLLRRLSYGELSNLAISGEGSGNIKDESRAKLIAYANEGLTRIYSRFILSEKSVLVETVEGITNYHLKTRFAESSGSDEPFQYIKDLFAEPFVEDVIRILDVYDSYGRKRVLNDDGDPDSLFTPRPDTLQVPHAKGGMALGIAYQARHPELFAEGHDVLGQYIDLPVFLEPALQQFVAHKVYSHMNGQDHVAKGIEYANAYEALCQEIESRDLTRSTWHTTHTKLEDRGFR